MNNSTKWAIRVTVCAAGILGLAYVIRSFLVVFEVWRPAFGLEPIFCYAQIVLFALLLVNASTLRAAR
ncbi:hypothetical protein AACH06_25465 [Ideonella sp. DXS29W]|uniref:Uncharacterized protein n=1 Tax=Ideonella lacteola TaxID=2984193 RepID=A0ABU9BWR6_9BURK